MDKGIYPLRYHLFVDEEDALQYEDQLASKLGIRQKWEDPEFPADGDSLYLDPYNLPKGGLPSIAFDWTRISSHGILGMTDPKLFGLGKAGGTKGEIIQGALGNRWLLNVFAILATRPKKLKELFVSDRHKDKGIYTLKIYKNGQWRHVQVDDRVPCTKAGTPYYCKSRDSNETWPLLLEKAYAKLHGCYEALTGGSIEDGLKDLSDGLTVKIEVNRTTIPKEIDQPNNLLNQLERLIKDGNLVGASLEPEADQPIASNRSRQTGIIPSHAYGIVGVRRFFAEPTETLDGQQLALIQCKNVWSEGKYKGPWSRYDPIWETYPKQKAEYLDKLISSDPQSFYITYQDFLLHFNTIYISITNLSPPATAFNDLSAPSQASKYTFKGTWAPGDPKSDAGGNPSYKTFGRNPQYVFHLTAYPTTTLAINLSQYDYRWQRHQPPLRAYDSSLGFFVVRVNGMKRRLGKFHTVKVMSQSPYFGNMRSISNLVSLPPGPYAIIPCTYTPCQDQERFLLEVIFDAKVEAEQGNGEPADVDTRESDDEGLEPENLCDKDFSRIVRKAPQEDASAQIYQSLQLQVADLSTYILNLKKEVEALEVIAQNIHYSEKKTSSRKHVGRIGEEACIL